VLVSKTAWRTRKSRSNPVELELAWVIGVDDDRYRVARVETGAVTESALSGPANSLGVRPAEGDLVALDATTAPPEIAHVYEPSAEEVSEGERLASARAEYPRIVARHTPLVASPFDPDARYMAWTGLAAEVWDPSGGDAPQFDLEYLRRVVRENAGPALDVGCGTGRILLPLIGDGLDVDGLEPSEDMVALCRDKATARGLTAIIHVQSMHQMDLPRRYATIMIPCGSFCLLVYREDALQALDRMYQHLVPGGELIFSLFFELGPEGLQCEEVSGLWRAMWHHELPTGGQVHQHMRAVRIDRVEQQYFGERRYRLVRDGQVLREEILPSFERIYGKYEIALMLERAGFTEVKVFDGWSDEPFAGKHASMMLRARRPAT
jgi:SAM-dependent methyltransferase